MKELKSFLQESAIAGFGYIAAIQFNWISEAVHWAVGVFTAVSCYIAVHYVKKLIKWLEER